MARDSCLARITAGVAVGGAVGGAVDLGVNIVHQLRAPERQTINCFKAKGANLVSIEFQHCAVYGTYEAIRYKVPGLLKIRYIGQTTLGSAAIFGLFLGAGSLIHCGKSY